MLESAFEDLQHNSDVIINPEELSILCAFPDPAERSENSDVMFSGTNERERLQQHLSRLTDKLFSIVDSRLATLPLQCVFGDRIAFARIIEKAIHIISSGEKQQCLLMVSDSLLYESTDG